MEAVNMRAYVCGVPWNVPRLLKNYSLDFSFIKQLRKKLNIIVVIFTALHE